MLCGEETNCFTVTWTIDNFKKFFVSTKHVQTLESSVFKTEDYINGKAWWRLASLSGKEFVLTPVEFGKNTKQKGSYKCEMSLLTSSGEIELNREHGSFWIGENSNIVLSHGRLTLCLRISHPNLIPGQYLLRNVLHELNIPWSIGIDDISFDSYATESVCYHQHETTVFCMRLAKRNSGSKTHHVNMRILPNCERWSTFLRCNISIEESQGKVVSGGLERAPSLTSNWDIEIYPEMCKTNLNLEFEMLFSTVVECHQFPLPSDANSLGEGLLQLYKNKTLSDVTLNVEGKAISAHRNILASRSQVFRAMFEKDRMIEGQSGVVDIPDVDTKTLDRLLVFLYSDSLEQLQWEEASALFYAADKYAVLPLKRKCGEILTDSLSLENACDLLVLADEHSEEHLMTATVDFVRKHKEVLSLPAWKKLEESHSKLIIKVLRQVIEN